MRKVWYVVMLVGFALMTAVFTSDHVRNVDNAWLWTAVLDHGNIILDLLTLYVASRVFNHIRTHEICKSEGKIGPLCVGIMAAWVLAIAIVVSQ